jgi:transposase InsO family protein
MKEHGIKARGKRKFVVTTDSKHNLPIAPNLFNRIFQPDAPSCVWTSDITYIQTDQAGYIWRWFSICIAVRSWAGACSRTCNQLGDGCAANGVV